MSGPFEERSAAFGSRALSTVEVREGRVARLGGVGIVRVLPTKRRRTVGPWCFVDLMTPDDVADPPPLEIGPHPHIGLATVTWLFEGSALHGDSLGTEQLIRPGQLNLMTSGHGIAHAEHGMRSELGERAGDFSGVQMWIAQPEGTRHGASGFEHIAELPRSDLSTGEATVLLGSLCGTASPAGIETPLVGADLVLAPAVEIPTDPCFEHAVVPLDRTVKVQNTLVAPGSLALVPIGAESLRLEVDGGRGRAMLLGGEPLGEDIQMWWNFVARTKDEITMAWQDWQTHDADRFGPVPSTLPRIDAPTPPWVRQDTEK